MAIIAEGLRLIVAGGGIGGLAAALAAAARGHRVTVLERQDRFEELGAGIQLAPNAFRALERLGVATAVRERAVYVSELRFMDGTSGRRVARMPLTGSYRRRFRNPYAVVHRGDLLEPLLAACRAAPGIELHAGQEVAAYEQSPDRVTAVTATGRRVGGDVLLGADGIRSAVRRRLIGDGEPRVSGHTVYRSVVPMAGVPPPLRSQSVTLWAGPDWHVVHYPIAGGTLLNLAATRADGARTAVTGAPAARAHVQRQFPGAHRGVRQLLLLGNRWRSWTSCDRDPVARWTDGRVALLGDAAHPMLQYAAQGACQALEDAVALGEELHDCRPAEAPGRLAAYNERRHERAASAQRVARALAERLYHPAGAAAAARNALLSSLTREELYDKVAWLHGPGDAVIPKGASR
ncbi:FAD-dependent monooxygenase [Streptomyces boninensis]|uniref:FAD-dependent monooxygenase n=1 Tax=Streptomyces boninensis TaxID=2039455 RepID=UPI003B221833